MTNKPDILCVEPDDVLLDYARKLFGDNVSFKKGFAENPPIPDIFVNLVIGNFLLNIVPDIKSVIAGMVKVAKPGGTVCCIEPFLIYSYTSDPRFEIINNGFVASHKGAWKLRSELIDYTKHPRDKHLSWRRY